MGGSSTRRAGIALVGLTAIVTLAACGSSGTGAPAVTTTATTAYEPLFGETVPTTAAPATTTPATTVPGGATTATTAPEGTLFAAADGSFDMVVPAGWVKTRAPSTDDATWSLSPIWTVARQTGGMAPMVQITTEAETAASLDELLAPPGDEWEGMTVEFSTLFPASEGRSLAYTAVKGVLPTSGWSVRGVIVTDLAGGRSVKATFVAPPDQFDELLNTVGPYLLTLHAH